MTGLIEQLQGKPERVRRRILYTSVTALSFIVLFVWVSTLDTRLAQAKEEPKGDSPFALLGEAFSQFSDNFKAGVEGIWNNIPFKEVE